MRLRSGTRTTFHGMLILAVTLLLCAAVSAAEGGHTHKPGPNWNPDDPSQHWRVCAVCGEKIDQGAHQWKLRAVEAEGSCTEERAEIYACTVCQRMQQRIIPASGHTWDQGQVSFLPTCGKEGKTTYTCTNCGKTRTESIPALEHKWDSGRISAPGCGKEGKTTYTCTNCGKTRTEPIPALEHEWDSGRVSAPGCGKEGKTTYTCTNCGKTRTEPIPALEHQWDSGRVSAPGCGKEGKTTYTCTNCGKTRTESIPALEHEWDSGRLSAPGCGKEGKTTYTCTNCGKTRTEPIPALEHQWDSGRVSAAPSCGKEGKKEYICALCGKTYTEGIAALGHDEDGIWEDSSSQHWRLCKTCGAKLHVEAHQWIGWVTEAGNHQSRRCETCGRTETRKGPDTVAPDLVAVAPDGRILEKSFVRGGQAYAVWEGEGTPSICSISHRFEDVNPGAWYGDTVTFVYSHGLLRGVSDDRFDPQGTMTRAMLAAAIYRIEGSPACQESFFTDVAPGTWYDEAVNWAASQEILAGIGGGKFAPNDPLTREQMVAILYRYAGYLGLNRTGRESLSRFTDSNSVSAYAVPAMEWSVSAGLISGMGDGRVAPKATATRAEVATVLRAMAIRITEELGVALD